MYYLFHSFSNKMQHGVEPTTDFLNTLQNISIVYPVDCAYGHILASSLYLNDTDSVPVHKYRATPLY